MEENEIGKPHKLLLVGGSAGSLNVMLKLLPLLRTDILLSIVVVLHRKNTFDTMLQDLFSSRTTLPVKEIEDKEVMQKGVIYLVPPDYHVLFEHNAILSLDYSEKVNYSRPSIDVAFESAAEVYGSNLITLLLSGASSDGVKGLIEAKRQKGITIVQDPDTAETPYMPMQALRFMKPDLILKPDEMSRYINSL